MTAQPVMTVQPAMTVTRFAPSPTGHLHRGHAYAALKAWQFARERDGRFLLRIEDIDFNRCDAANTEQIFEDLAWLGLDWEKPVRIQSEHFKDYHRAAERLRDGGFLYPCFCTRKDIEREIEAAGQAPHGSEGAIYPGICRHLPNDEQDARIAAGEAHALRLNLEKALEEVGRNLSWHDSTAGEQSAAPERLGDAVIVRKDIGTSYHLAVVVDDGLQGITDIVRGVDLFESTHLHVVLQRLLGLPTPRYHHHPLLTDSEGNRLAKRNQSITLKALRETGLTAEELVEACVPRE